MQMWGERCAKLEFALPGGVGDGKGAIGGKRQRNCEGASSPQGGRNHGAVRGALYWYTRGGVARRIGGV